MNNSNPTPVIPPIPDESFNFSAPPAGEALVATTPAAPSPTSSGNGTVKPNRRIGGRVIATIFGLLLLVGGVGAGLILVQQQQVLKQKAATSCTVAYSGTGGYNGTPDTFTLTGDCGTVPIQKFLGSSCPNNSNPEGGATFSATGGTYTPNPPAGSCEQVDYQQDLNLPGGGVCKCAPASTTTTSPTPTTTSLKACGESCTKDSDCVTGAQDQGITTACIGGVCVNKACPTKTHPGAICYCDTLNACGQKCGAAVGLCQTGSQCGYIAGGTQCAAPGTLGDINNTYCIPTSPSNGYTTGQCTGIATIYLKKPDGTVVNSQADVLIACGPQATAQCSSIKAYDTNWNLLTSSQLSALTAGAKVRFTVMGTTTSGTFDKARFTVNGTQTPEVTTQKPNSSGEFYYEYTIATGVTSFSVTGEVHQSLLNVWY